ncbi:MAG: ABC transporter ATP-binding protein, partial [Microbacterium gubbeenense]
TLIVVEHRADVWRDVIDREVRLGAAGTTTADFGGTWSAGPETSGSAAEMPYASAPLLEARGLTVARVRGRVVAGPIDLAVMPGEVLGITGANGSGKSTLGRTLAGLLPPAGGAVVASDELRGGAKADPIRWTSAQLLTRIGTVLQSPDHQLLAKTVRDEIEVGPRALQLSEGEIGRRTDDLLERLRLDHLAAAHPHTLSGGEKRRLTVGAMLATRPRVCVLDEPTFGQDPQTWREMVAIMSALAADGIAIVAITHDLGLLHALGAREFRMGVSG